MAVGFFGTLSYTFMVALDISGVLVKKDTLDHFANSKIEVKSLSNVT